MQTLKELLLILFCLIFSIYSYGQQISQPVKLKDLLMKVNQKAPTLLTDSASILIRRAQAAEVRGNWLPNLKLNYQTDIGTNNNDAGPYFGFGIIPSDTRGVRINSNTTVVSANVGVAALDWEIYNFGAYGAQNRVANSEINVGISQFNQSKFQLEAYTINNYLQLLRLQDYLNIQVRNIQRNQEIRKSVQSLAKSGIRPGVDTSIAEAELSKARLNYIELLNQLKQLQLQLSAISGIPYQSVIPDTMVTKKLLNNFMYDSLNSPDTGNHPLINYYKALYQNSIDREELVKKSYNPKLMFEGAIWGRGSSIDANDHFNNISSGLGFNRNNYLIGLGITYNVFDLPRRHLRLSTQKTITNYTLKSLQEEQAGIGLESSQANEEINTARQRLQEIPNQLNAANAGYRQKLSLYRSGLTDIIELNAALNILYRAETDYVSAKYNYNHALFQKALAENQVNNILNLLN
jgi:adhesin transport system outer membrane protein